MHLCPPHVVGRRHHGSFPGKNAPRIFTIPRATIIFFRGSVIMPSGVNCGVSGEYSTVRYGGAAAVPCSRGKMGLTPLILVLTAEIRKLVPVQDHESRPLNAGSMAWVDLANIKSCPLMRDRVADVGYRFNHVPV